MEKIELGLYKRSVARRIAFIMAVLLMISLLIAPGLAAEKEIAIKINYRGLRFNSHQKWETVPLQGTFKGFLNQQPVGDLFKADGEFGLFKIDSTIDQGTFTFEQVDEANPYYTFDSTLASYSWHGEKELIINLWAYAKQGLFSLDAYIEGLKTAKEEGTFEVFNEKRENILRFNLEEAKYISLPEGKYILHQVSSPKGTMPVKDIPFTVQSYKKEEDVTALTINNELLSQLKGKGQGKDFRFAMAPVNGGKNHSTENLFAINYTGTPLPLGAQVKNLEMIFSDLTGTEKDGTTVTDGKVFFSSVTLPASNSEMALFMEGMTAVGEIEKTTLMPGGTYRFTNGEIEKITLSLTGEEENIPLPQGFFDNIQIGLTSQANPLIKGASFLAEMTFEIGYLNNQREEKKLPVAEKQQVFLPLFEPKTTIIEESLVKTKEGLTLTLQKISGEVAKDFVLGLALPKGNLEKTGVIQVNGKEEKATAIFKGDNEDFIVFSLDGEIAFENGALTLLIPAENTCLFDYISLYYQDKGILGITENTPYMDIALEQGKGQYVKKDLYDFVAENKNALWADKTLEGNRFTWQRANIEGVSFLHLPAGFTLNQAPEGSQGVFVSEKANAAGKDVWTLAGDYQGLWENIKSLASTTQGEVTFISTSYQDPLTFTVASENQEEQKILVTLAEKVENLAEGLVYQDKNNNGKIDEGEAGIPNLPVYMKAANSSYWVAAQTNSEGVFFYNDNEDFEKLYFTLPKHAYSLVLEESQTGLYTLKEKAVLNAVPVVTKGSLKVVVTDKNSNAPIPYTKVELLLKNRTLAEGETDEQGQVLFEGLEEGTYAIKAVLGDEAKGKGFLTHEGFYEKEVAIIQEEEKLEEIPYTFFAWLEVVHHKTTQSLKQGGELRLYEKDTLIEAKELTDAGEMVFGPLYPGEYKVSFTLPEEIILSTVNGNKVLAKQAYEMSINVLKADQKLDLEWIMPSTISLNEITGLKADNLLKGELTGPEERSFSFTFNDENKTIEGLLPGEYHLSITLADNVITDGFEDEYWQLEGNRLSTTLLAAKEEKAVAPAITLSTYGEVFGSLWDDVKGQGIIDRTTLPLRNITVKLEKQEGKNPNIFTQQVSVVSDDEGMYRFGQLSPGRYRLIVEVPKEGTVTTRQLGSIKRQQYVLEPFTLGSGEEKEIEKIGLAVPSGAQVIAFWDTNKNGVKGPYEPGIAQAKVDVINHKEEVVATALTDQEGKAVFRELPLGEYQAVITLPQGYWFGNKGQPQGKNVFSSVAKVDSTQSTSDSFTVIQGVATQVGAGAEKTGAISGIMWEDLNGNGLMDDGEPGLMEATVTITGNKTGSTYTLTPDSQGAYSIELRPDTYKMYFSGPQGYIFTRYSATGGDRRSYFTQQGENQGEIQAVVEEGADVVNPKAGWMKSAALKGKAFIDENYNGKMDDGEQVLQGAEVTLLRSSGEVLGKTVTDNQGAFVFQNLRGEKYTVQATLAEDALVYSKKGEETPGIINHFIGSLNSKTATAAIEVEDGVEEEIGIGALYPAGLGGQVFLDENYNGLFENSEKGLKDVKVGLYAANGNLVQEGKTGPNGEYTFAGLMPQDYYIEVTLPENYTVTIINEEEITDKNILKNNGQTALFPLIMGEEKEELFFGLVQSGSVTGKMYYDTNDNGLWDEEEGPYQDLEATLYIDETHELVQKTATGADGTFVFNGVLPGEYYVTYHLLENEVISKTNEADYQAHGAGEIRGETFTLTMAEEMERPALGALPLGAVSGSVFFDSNGNGLWDEGEKALAGLTVTYTGENSAQKPTAITTDEEGMFLAQGLRPDEYHFTLVLEDGLVFSRQGDEPFMTKRGQSQGEAMVNLSAGEVAGGHLVALTRPGSMEGAFWRDENDNGLKEGQEPPIEGVTIRVVDEANGEEILLTSTREDGKYATDNLLPGRYSLKALIPAGYGAGKASEENLFMEDAEGGLKSATIIVESGKTTSQGNGALIKYTAITGKAWTENNGDIVPLEGVVLRLKNINRDEIVAQSMTAASSGEYVFAGLRPGEYQIEAVLPTEYLFVREWDEKITSQGNTSIIVKGMGGVSKPFTLTMGEDLSQMDIGAVVTGKIGDRAWIDENQNGLQDTGEKYLAGIEVVLYQNEEIITQAITDENGYYLFENIYPTSGQIKVKMPKEVIPTTINQDFPLLTNALVGYNEEEAYTQPFTLKSGEKYFHCDLGFVLIQDGVYPEGAVSPPSQNWSWTN